MTNNDGSSSSLHRTFDECMDDAHDTAHINPDLSDIFACSDFDAVECSSEDFAEFERRFSVNKHREKFSDECLKVKGLSCKVVSLMEESDEDKDTAVQNVTSSQCSRVKDTVMYEDTAGENATSSQGSKAEYIAVNGIPAMDEEAGMFIVHQTIGTVLCCKCGISMQPNAANMCVGCLRSEVNITDGLLKHLKIIFCPDCKTYLQPPKTRIRAERESRELLTFCLKKLNLDKAKVKVVDAAFSWTEPNSKRIMVRLKIQKEVLHGAVVEKSYNVQYVEHFQLCEYCSKLQANPDQWVAAVQLRQRVSHRRTFLYLEQLILKHDAAAKAMRIQQMDKGIDFFFSNRNHAVKFVDFVGKVAPIKSRSDKQLVSQDTKSNTYNYRHTFSVDICPICREDLVCLPPKVAINFGNLGPLVICTKVTNSIMLMDPNTLRYCFLEADQYWRSNFNSLLSSRRLVEYIVLDIDNVSAVVNVCGSRYALADAQVARVSDFGRNDTIFHIRTHLGHLLNPGDYALGYDLYGANTNDSELDKYKGIVPEVILLKKSYEEKRRGKRGKPRAWKLKHLNIEVDESTRGKVDQDKEEDEYEKFKRDLEENPELRFNISLYRNEEYQPSESASMVDGDELPAVALEELLGDLHLSD